MKRRPRARGPDAKMRDLYAALNDDTFRVPLESVHRAVHPRALRLPIPECVEPTTARLVVAAQLSAIQAAQRDIAIAMLELEERVNHLATDKGLLRRDRERRLAEIEVRRHIWRRLADSILWDLALGHDWLLKNLGAGGPRPRLSTSNLENGLRALVKYSSPLRVGFLADLTSFIDVGDLLCFDLAVGTIEVRELKEGRMNTILLPEAKAHVAQKIANDELLSARMTAEHGEHAGPQVLRMVRQLRRLAQVDELLTNNIGKDLSGANTILTEEVSILRGFDAAILQLLEGMRRQPHKWWMTDTVENDTLFIGAYRGPMRRPEVFDGWFNGYGARGPIVDVLGGLFSLDTPPLFSKVPRWELLEPVLRGDVRLTIGLNLSGLEKLAAEIGFTLEWGGRKKSNRWKAEVVPPAKLFEWNGSVAFATAGDLEIAMGEGSVARMFYDFTLPSEVLRMLDPRKTRELFSEPASRDKPQGDSETV